MTVLTWSTEFLFLLPFRRVRADLTSGKLKLSFWATRALLTVCSTIFIQSQANRIISIQDSLPETDTMSASEAANVSKPETDIISLSGVASEAEPVIEPVVETGTTLAAKIGNDQKFKPEASKLQTEHNVETNTYDTLGKSGNLGGAIVEEEYIILIPTTPRYALLIFAFLH
jgi:hypothetical protein